MVDRLAVPLEITMRRARPDPTFGPDGMSQGEGKTAGDTPFVEPAVRAAENTSDAATQFMIRTQQAQSDALERRAREKYGVPSAAGSPSSPVAPAPAPADPSQAAAPSAAPGGADEGGYSPSIDGVDPTAVDKLKAFPAIVGREIVHAPAAAGSGVGKAVSEVFKSVDSLGDWFNTHVVDTTIPIPKTGSQTVDDVLANPATAIAHLVEAITPTAGKSATAPVIESVAQFLTGMAMGGKALRAAGVALKGGKMALTAGAVSDALAFDPKEDSLAALLKTVPALEKVVPDFLATHPDDNEALNRLRRSVEGLGLGVATEGLLQAFRLYRAQRAARKAELEPAKAAVDPLAADRAKYGELTQSDLDARLGARGDAEAKLVEFDAKGGPTAEQIAAAGTDPEKLVALKAEHKPAAGDLPGGRIAINWARIDTADDVKAAMREMADHFRSSIKKARRDKMSAEDTKSLADDLGMTVDDLLARREGQALNAEETLAARRLLTHATEKLMEAAKIAAAPNAGPVDLYAFRRMLSVQAAIQNEVLAARAEAGRALASWKIPATAKGDVERSRALIDALEAGGGEDLARDLARRIGVLADTGVDAAGINATVRASAGARTWNAVSEVWVNALLSNPKTHLVNIASNTLALGQQIIERGLAEKFATLMRIEGGAVEGVAPGEAAAMIQGLVSAQKDAWKAAWLALRTGETGHTIGKVDLAHGAAVSAETFRLEGSQLGRFVDFVGTAERVPGRLLASEDEFFKSIGYRMEVYAQAQRQATSEGLSGAELRARFAELVAIPPEHIRLAAVDAALYTTFTNKAGDAAKALIRLREAWPPVMFILPFVKTPINIVRYSFERTPLAPFMGSVQADIAAGGARRELALARIATGTSAMLMAADYADRGLVTGRGPVDAGKREALERQGWKPYSMRVGDEWVTYDRLDPYGMLFGFAADMAEFSKRMDIDGDKLDEFSEIWAAGISAVSQTVVNKSYLSGLSDVMWMIEDPQRRAFDYLGREAGTIVPAGVAMAKQLGDPVMREHMKIWDYVQGRLPGFSEGLTPARDLWGKERQPDAENGSAFNALSPVQASAVKPSPIDAEMARLNIGIDRIDKKTMVAGVPMNFRDWPAVYDRYVVLAGNELKDIVSKKGAHDHLDDVVQGKGGVDGTMYAMSADGSEGGRADIIRATVARYRQQAQAAILADPAFAAFQAAWREQRDIEQAKKQKLEAVKPITTPDIARPMPPGAAPLNGPPGAQPMNAPPATLSPMRAP